MNLKTNENSPNHAALFRFLEVLNKSSDESFPTEIEKVLDVDKFLRFLAVSVMIVHLDNYIGMGHNYYLYEADGKFTVIPWDLNLAFGTFDMGTNGSTADFSIDEPVTGSFTERPLVSRILAHKPYLDKYHQYLRQMLNGSFAEGVIEQRIDELAKLIRPIVEADNLKLSSNEGFEQSVSDNPVYSSSGGFNRGGFGGKGPGRGGGGPGMNAPLLKSFIKQRRVSVSEQLDGKRTDSGQAGGQRGGPDMFNRF
jgi:spore coat protein CotH